MLKQIETRYKALIAALGGVLVYLQGVQASNPNKYVSLAIIILMVIGVHQISNKE